MTKIFPIVVNDEFTNLERLQHDVNARINLLSFLINSNNITSDSFRLYEQEYLALYTEYEHAKSQFETSVVRPLAKEDNIEIFTWSLDFENHTVTIQY